MEAPPKLTTVSFNPAMHRVQQGLAEDAVDLAVFEARDNEPLVSYKAVMKGLKVSGRL